MSPTSTLKPLGSKDSIVGSVRASGPGLACRLNNCSLSSEPSIFPGGTNSPPICKLENRQNRMILEPSSMPEEGLHMVMEIRSRLGGPCNGPKQLGRCRHNWSDFLSHKAQSSGSPQAVNNPEDPFAAGVRGCAWGKSKRAGGLFD